MADKVIKLDMSFIEADPSSTPGKVVNIYDTYANALAHGETGLQVVKAVDPLDNSVGVTIPQRSPKGTAPATGATNIGPEVDINGKLLIALDDGVTEYYANGTAGRFGGPLKITV